MSTTPSIAAVWRPTRRHDWRDAEIVGEHSDTGELVLRETGKFWPGIWLAPRDAVRIAGPEFETTSGPADQQSKIKG